MLSYWVLATCLEPWKKKLGGYRKFHVIYSLYFHLNLSSFLAKFSNGRFVSEILNLFSPHFIFRYLLAEIPHKIRLYILPAFAVEKIRWNSTHPIAFVCFFRTECSSSRFFFRQRFCRTSCLRGAKCSGCVFWDAAIWVFPPFSTLPPSTKVGSNSGKLRFSSGFPTKNVMSSWWWRGSLDPKQKRHFFWPFLSPSCWTYPQVQAGGVRDTLLKKRKELYCLWKCWMHIEGNLSIGAGKDTFRIWNLGLIFVGWFFCCKGKQRSCWIRSFYCRKPHVISLFFFLAQNF